MKEVIRNRDKAEVWQLFQGSWGARKGAYATGQRIAKALEDPTLIHCLAELVRYAPISAMGDSNVQGIIRKELRQRNWSNDFVYSNDYNEYMNVLGFDLNGSPILRSAQ